MALLRSAILPYIAVNISLLRNDPDVSLDVSLDASGKISALMNLICWR
jgi:hypothetical protein